MAKANKQQHGLEVGQRQRVEGLVCRAQTNVTAAIEDEDKRTVRVSFSSETPYKRASFWEDPWIEVLGHKSGEVNLDRLNNGASVDWNHSRAREDRLGAVLEASLEKGGRTSALLQFSERDSIDDIWNDLRAGLITNTSVLYRIHERVLTRAHDDGPDEFRVTNWEPMNLSLVDIPADPTVGVGRGEGSGHYYRVIDLEPLLARAGEQSEEIVMGDKTKTGKLAGQTGDDDTVTKSVAEELAKKAADDAAVEARKQALADEGTRQNEIRSVFDGQVATDDSETILQKCIEDQQCTSDMARKLLLDEIGKRKSPTGVGHLESGVDAADKFRMAVVQSIESRAGVKGAEIDLENPYRGLSIVELARSALTFNNLNAGGSRSEVIGRAFTMRASGIGLTPSDLSTILADVANKAVLLGFDEAEETWPIWCHVGNISDFKTARRVGLSSFEDLELIGPGGEYKYGKFTDTGETIQLASYGKIFPITRQAMINDDLQVLTAIPSKMGRAAARVPGDLAYIALTSNPVMGDGTVLFHAANHANIGTGGVISITTVEEAMTLMALQTDVNAGANGLNTQLGFILVPVQIKGVAVTLMKSEFDPASTTNSRAPNSVANQFEVVAEPRLSADSALIWYAVAQQRFDTVEVAFLDGIQAPRVEEKAGWTVDGVETKVALDVAASPMEWRSFVRNAGA